ncbi:MAG: chlorohydrolase [Euryarchaeota archaeon]|nr:chlorohydrolase [Euryarchaeota archaeon]
MEPRRVTSTRLITEAGRVHRGDVLLFSDGSWSESHGDEDVIETIDGSNRVITRSFQNWHTHLPMILNRSMGEGLPLMEWLQASIFPTERHVTKELIEVGTRAALAELIATGTTFACDMYHHPDAIAPVIAESGIRGIVCGPTTDWPPSAQDMSDSGEALKNLEGLLSEEPLADGRVRYGIAAHAVYTCSEETLLRASELGRRYSAPVHIHTSETRQEVANCHAEHGMYPIEYLDSIGFLEEGTVCAHCGWVTKKEMRILAEKKCHAVHCPISNQKLACGGTMSYPAMKEANVDVRLGTDGAASNNSLDMRAEAKAASLIQRHDHWDARILDPVETWQLATKGSKDWITWDLNDVRLRPTGRDDRRLLANLIYSGGRVLDVFVDGEAIRRDGVTLTIDELASIEQLEDSAREYYSHI